MIDDEIRPLEQIEPIYLDRGIFFGDGVYEVLRSYAGRIFALQQHLERFSRSLAAIGISGIDMELVRSRVLRAFETAGIAEAKIYFHVTRGSAPRIHLPPPELQPAFFLTITPIEDCTGLITRGITVSTYPDIRWKRCDIKPLNLLPNVLARRDAQEKDCDEAVFVDDAGLITEGASSTFFALFGRQLRTAPLSANILPSITRDYVLRAARNIGLVPVEQSVPAAEAAAADELFIASTTREIVPVVEFDGRAIADGRPGKELRRLIDEFRRFTV